VRALIRRLGPAIVAFQEGLDGVECVCQAQHDVLVPVQACALHGLLPPQILGHVFEGGLGRELLWQQAFQGECRARTRGCQHGWCAMRADAAMPAEGPAPGPQEMRGNTRILVV